MRYRLVHRLSDSKITRKLTKLETNTEDMDTSEVRSNLHKIVDRIEDDNLFP